MHKGEGLPGAVSSAPEDLVVVPGFVASSCAEGAAAARDRFDVATAVLRPLVALPGVRAGAVVQVHDRDAVTVTASLGYDCGTMDAGSRLPMASGLPVTEAVRRTRPVVRGDGPGWVALPFGGTPSTGALLLSLTSPPPGPDGLGTLLAVARVLGQALERAAEAEQQLGELAALQARLAALEPRSGTSYAARCRPYDGDTCGDVIDAVSTEAGVSWLLVADVAGSGPRAAVTAHGLRAAFRAALALTSSPGEVLRALDRAVDDGPEGFATALVLRREGTRAVAATAGHPPPLLSGPQGVREAGLPAAPPVGCGLLVDDPPTRELHIGEDELLLAWTDGMVDRDVEVDLASVLRRIDPRRPVDDVADEVLRACEQHGRPRDDASLVVVRS